MKVPWRKSDGGRAEAGFKGRAGDCVTRAICNAGGYDYREIYDLVNGYAKVERQTPKMTSRSSARSARPTGLDAEPQIERRDTYPRAR